MALPPITLFHELNALVTPYPAEQSTLAQAVTEGSVTEYTCGKHINFGSRLTILFFFYIDKSDMLGILNLRSIACYFHIFINYNIISIEAILITIYHYNIILLSICIILYIRSLQLITTCYQFAPCLLMNLLPYPHTNPLVTTILLF